jgi:hypothetical protein
MGLDIRISLHYSRKEFYLEESNYKVDSLPDMAKYQNSIINSALLYTSTSQPLSGVLLKKDASDIYKPQQEKLPSSVSCFSGEHVL